MQQPGGADGSLPLLLPLLLLLRTGSRAEPGDATQGKGDTAGGGPGWAESSRAGSEGSLPLTSSGGSMLGLCLIAS